jgi:hypothetical protein
MICPSCQEDFEPQVAHCPYCGAPSPFGVRADADEGDGEDLGPLVPLVELWNPADLSRVTDALEKRGVPFLVQGQSSFRSLGVSGLLRGEDAMTEAHEILVPEALVAEASAVLEELET